MKDLEIIEILKTEFAQIRERNPSFSMRSYAKRLGLSPAQLSQLLSGKRNFTATTVSRISKTLNFSPEVERRVYRQTFSKENFVTQEDSQKRRLAEDEFALISDWFHLAILSLAKLKNAKADAHWISHRLGITPGQANTALERLVRLDIIESGKSLKQKGEMLNVTSAIPSGAIRKYHKQILDKSIEKIDSCPLSKRDYSAITFLADPRKIDLVRERIEKFQDEMTELMSGPHSNEVFILSTQLYSLEEEQK